MSKRRVVITGMGVVAPNGIGKDAFWNNLINGKSGIKKITLFDASSFPTQIAGEVRDFEPFLYMERKKASRISRSSQFAIAAAKMALEDSELLERPEILSSAGIIIGMNINAVEIIEHEHKVLLDKGVKSMNPFSAGVCSSYAPANDISSEFGCKNFSITVSSGCTAGLSAVGRGFQEIIHNDVKVIIVGGVDTPITPLSFGSFCASGIMTRQNNSLSKSSRPFDRKRDGGVLAEGAAVFVLEELDHAVARGAHIYGEVIGYGELGDAHNILKIENEEVGMKKAMELALGYTMINKIDYISAHGPSDIIADKAETIAIKKVFSEYAYKLPISSIKSMTGNPLAAAGPMQVIAALMTIKDGIIPPTINYEYPDPDCDLDYVPNEARMNKVDTVLVNSHGFGGSNASLVISNFSKV